MDCGHRGTTILLKMLGTHSNICSIGGETSFIKKKR